MVVALVVLLFAAPSQLPAGEGLPAPTPAPTSAPAVEAQARLADAEARLRGLDDARARDVAAALADDPTQPASVRVRAGLVLGQARVNLGDSAGAVAAFRAALGTDTKAALPADAPVAARRAFEDAQKSLAAPPVPKAAPLPPKEDPTQEPILQWMRPSSVVLMVAGGVALAAGALVVVAGVVAREWAIRSGDKLEQQTITRALVPLAVFAGTFILGSIPLGGLGLAMFFLSSLDGPLKPKPAAAAAAE